MNPYKVLGIDKDASTLKVRKAFRSLSKIHHPDKGGDPRKFHELSLAHEILSDRDRRERYDRTGRLEASRITPERVKQFLRGTLQGALNSRDNLETVDIKQRVIESIQAGKGQAQMQRGQFENRIKRAEKMSQRLVKKEQTESLMHQILRSEIDDMLKEIEKIDDAVELADEAIKAFEDYDYKVDPAPEGPFGTGPTVNHRYGGSSTTWMG